RGGTEQTARAERGTRRGALQDVAAGSPSGNGMFAAFLGHGISSQSRCLALSKRQPSLIGVILAEECGLVACRGLLEASSRICARGLYLLDSGEATDKLIFLGY